MNESLNYAKGTAGAVGGAIVGAICFYALAKLGFYAGVLVGGFAGWFCEMSFQGKSWKMGLIAATIALVGALLAEWYVFRNWPLGEFVFNLHKLPLVSQIMIAIGTIAAFTIGRGK